MTAQVPLRRMLFISPKFFGYESSMQHAFEELGVEVDFIDERPNNSALARAVIRAMPRLMGWQIRRHYSQQQSLIRNKRYDYVFLLKGEVVPDDFLDEVWRLNPAAKRIFYTYDSLVNTPMSQRHLRSFDHCWTIDYSDAEVEPQLKVLPLFYTPDFSPAADSQDRPYELSFVGTVHSGRYEAVTALMAKFKNPFRFFYCPAPWYFFLSKYLLGGDFSRVAYDDVSFKKLNRREVAEVFRNSIAVADIQRRGQSGLTMRTFEVLASGAALITTNRHVSLLGATIGQKVLVLDDFTTEDSQEKARSFVERVKGNRQPPSNMDDYSLRSWAVKLLDIDSAAPEPMKQGRSYQQEQARNCADTV